MLKCLCANTRKNAAKNKDNGRTFTWNEITPKNYLGLLLYMAVCNFPKMVDFWRRNIIFHVPATVMSRDQFMAITSNLHISDPEEEDEVNDQKDHRGL